MALTASLIAGLGCPAEGTLSQSLTGGEDTGGDDGFGLPGDSDPQGNSPPDAGFDHTALGFVLTVTDRSSDSDGSVVYHEWSFGDGHVSAGENVTHVYSSPGAYDVTLTIGDDDGATASQTKTVTVSDPSTGHAPNLLFIITDQQRFDALGLVQNELTDYDGKLKIKTPNLDRLAARGAYFRNAYSASPVCAPARASLRTGCTIERTGVQSNSLANRKTYELSAQFENKIEALETYDQLLVEEGGYAAETYGKWHMPLVFYNERDSSSSVISYNHYDYEASSPKLTVDWSQGSWGRIYKKALQHHTDRDGIKPTFENGQQENTFSNFPYDPIRLDVRYGASTNTSLDTSQPDVCGRNSLSSNYTNTHFAGDMAIKALERLSRAGKPFSLTVSFHSPHAPMVPPPEYYDHYYENRAQLFVSPSIADPMDNSAYKNSNGRTRLLDVGRGYNDPDQVKEWTATYYALVEEIDTWIGTLLDKLEERCIDGNTMVVFTSDHGEMLGAHAMREKNIFLEESAHIPLLISFPGRIAPGTVVDEPVGHIDVFATILDYFGLSHLDDSDGVSTRRFIERSSFNETYDERTVVSEWDFRTPETDGSLSRSLGGEVSFMVRKGNYKLMLTKKEDSDKIDMMYNVADDPYEMSNLLGANGANADSSVIGKAEHLKVLLLEWMQRHNGAAGYYSEPKYNNNEGRGDIAEIRARRTWRTLDYWQSDVRLSFGKPVRRGDEYLRNEYLYIGRTNPGTLTVTDILVKGEDAKYFSVDSTRASVTQGDHVRVKVAFRSSEPVAIRELRAHVEISYDGHGTATVEIGGE